MKKIFSFVLFIMIFLCFSNAKAKVLSESEYKSYGIKRGYVICNYIFDISKHNPTLKDFLLASQTCSKDNVTIYEIKYGKDINGNITTSYVELLENKKITSFPNLDVTIIFSSEIMTSNHDKEIKIVISDSNTSIDEEIYYVRFNVNGGTTIRVPEPQYTIKQNYGIIVKNGEKYGEGCTIKGRMPVANRNDYIFNGWNTKSDGSGETITADTIVNLHNNIELYATWKKAIKANYVIVYPDKDNYSSYLDVSEGEKVNYFNALLDGELYKSEGIYKDLALTVPYDSNDVITSTKTYYIKAVPETINIHTKVSGNGTIRSEENTSELQSLDRISYYVVFY